MNKKKLINNIITHLQQELTTILTAANNAHLAAIDDQSVAETQYDTLAIEASYLAEGQSRRVVEIKAAINAFTNVVLTDFSDNTPITTGALVQLAQDKNEQQWFFIGPAAGGYRGKVDEINFTVITTQSPMGMALIDKALGDEIEISLGGKNLSDVISAVL